MDDDLERLHECRCRTYRACWVGFSLYAVNLAATTLVEVITLLLLFSGHNPNLGRWLGIDLFDLRFDTARVWGRLVACLALASAWPADRGWRRRAALLLAMAIGDVVLWANLEAIPLGLADAPSRHLVLLRYTRMVLGWSRFLLLASLASDFVRHAGRPGAKELGRSARTTAMVGAAVWFASFVVRIDWSRPWPLAERPFDPASFQLLMASAMINMVCLVQASLLTFVAAQAAGPLLRESSREAKGFDPWSETAVETP